MFLVGDNGKCCLLSWQSKRIRRIVRSSLASEALAMSDCVDGTFFVSSLYHEVMFGLGKEKLHIDIVTDNRSLENAVKSSKYVTEKRLRLDISAVK